MSVIEDIAKSVGLDTVKPFCCVQQLLWSLPNTLSKVQFSSTQMLGFSFVILSTTPHQNVPKNKPKQTTPTKQAQPHPANSPRTKQHDTASKLQMGIIFSAYTIASNSIKKTRDKRKSRKTSQAPAQATASHGQGEAQIEQPLSPQQEEEQLLRERLRVEHLAAVPPPLIPSAEHAGTEAEKKEKDLGGGVRVSAPGQT